MMNEEILKGKWNEIKGEIHTKWAKLTDEELEKSKGNLTSVAGLIQQRYGVKKDEIEDALKKILSRFTQKSEKLKNALGDDDQILKH